MSWQPIETAPKDGTEILIAIPLKWEHKQKRIGTGIYVQAVWFDDDVWRNRIGQWVRDTTPTHWMPLPNHPDQKD